MASTLSLTWHMGLHEAMHSEWLHGPTHTRLQGLLQAQTPTAHLHQNEGTFDMSVMLLVSCRAVCQSAFNLHPTPSPLPCSHGSSSSGKSESSVTSSPRLQRGKAATASPPKKHPLCSEPLPSSTMLVLVIFRIEPYIYQGSMSCSMLFSI